MQLLTLAQAAERLGLKLATVRFWVWTGKIGHVKVGRSVRVPDTVVADLIERGTVPARRDP
jgi:excisionase family DNA binding protein